MYVCVYQVALAGRDETSLEPVVSFLLKYVTNPRYSRLLVDICGTVLELYASYLGKSIAIDELMWKLRQRLHEEETLQTQLFSVLGALNMVITANGYLSEHKDVSSSLLAPNNINNKVVSDSSGGDEEEKKGEEKEDRKSSATQNKKKRRKVK